MKKIVLLGIVVVLLAIPVTIPINLTNTGITGFFVNVGLTGYALAKEILKTILTFIVNRL